MYQIDKCDCSKLPMLMENFDGKKLSHLVIHFFINLSDASSITARIQNAVGGTLSTIDDPFSDEVDEILLILGA